MVAAIDCGGALFAAALTTKSMPLYANHQLEDRGLPLGQVGFALKNLNVQILVPLVWLVGSKSTGQMFTPESPRINDNGVRVPTHLFMQGYDPHDNWAGRIRRITGRGLIGHPISYQELLKRTCVEFLPDSEL